MALTTEDKAEIVRIAREATAHLMGIPWSSATDEPLATKQARDRLASI